MLVCIGLILFARPLIGLALKPPKTSGLKFFKNKLDNGCYFLLLLNHKKKTLRAVCFLSFFLIFKHVGGCGGFNLASSYRWISRFSLWRVNRKQRCVFILFNYIYVYIYMQSSTVQLYLMQPVGIICWQLVINGLFGSRGEGEGVKESKIVLAKNKLILCQIYSTLPPSPSIQIDHKARGYHQSFNALVKLCRTT